MVQHLEKAPKPAQNLHYREKVQFSPTVVEVGVKPIFQVHRRARVRGRALELDSDFLVLRRKVNPAQYFRLVVHCPFPFL